MRPLSILFASGMRSLKYGGVERAIVELSRQAQDRGHVMHTVWDGRPSSRVLVEDLLGVGATIHSLPANLPFVRAVRAWRELMESVRPDIVHANFNPSAQAAMAGARLVGTPTVWTLHQMPAIPEGPSLRRLRARVAMAGRVALAGELDAVSEASRRAWLALSPPGTRIQVHYMGTELPRAQRDRAAVRAELGLPSDACVIACVAFHDPGKGVDVLIDAFARLAPKHPRLRLLQIGGPLRQEDGDALRVQVDRLGLSDRVCWAGWRDDVPDLLAASDLYVQPSRHEGLGLALVEAAASRLPCVGTRQGGIPEVISDPETGRLVPPADPVAMAAALSDLIENPGLRAHLGAAAQADVAARFDIRRQTALRLDRYEAQVG